MFKLLKYLKHYRKECILSPLFKLLEASFELLVPLVMAAIIDKGIASGNRLYIYGRGGLLVLMGIVGLCSAVTAQYFASKAAAGFGTELRNDLFRHIMGLSRAETDSMGQATLITRMTNDSNQIQNGVNMFFRLVLRSPFIVFGAMVLAYTIDGREGMLFTAVIAVLFVIVFFIMRRSVALYRTVQKKLDGLLRSTSENLEGVRVVRAFRREGAEKDAYRNAAGELSEEQILVGKISALMNPLTYAVINLALAAVLQTGAVHVNVGTLTQGQVVALVNYISQILVELLKLANLIILLSKASACANRIDEVFAVANSMADGTADASSAVPSVEFRDVGFTYPGSPSESLSGISFTAAPGETVGIIGGTGSGKTTLASLIMRFYDAGRGEVLIGGKNIRTYSLESLRKCVGIVEQNVRLFSGTIRENLLWGDGAAGDAALLAAAGTARAVGVITAKEGALDSAVEQLGRNFSGGQKQRLSIARTLVRKPRILILDDSSSALDFATDAALRKAVRKDCADSTVFIISQRVTTIKNADRIIVLDDGKMAGYGPHRELIRNCPVYREICLSQLSEKETAAV
ncbi:MAG TPA: ATP-binding protein [Treponema sp.]|nr:ATP-binding protein [Treponema sp.]